MSFLSVFDNAWNVFTYSLQSFACTGRDLRPSSEPLLHTTAATLRQEALFKWCPVSPTWRGKWQWSDKVNHAPHIRELGGVKIMFLNLTHNLHVLSGSDLCGSPVLKQPYEKLSSNSNLKNKINLTNFPSPCTLHRTWMKNMHTSTVLNNPRIWKKHAPFRKPFLSLMHRSIELVCLSVPCQMQTYAPITDYTTRSTLQPSLISNVAASSIQSQWAKIEMSNSSCEPYIDVHGSKFVARRK
jgi:hypothetical protein